MALDDLPEFLTVEEAARVLRPAPPLGSRRPAPTPHLLRPSTPPRLPSGPPPHLPDLLISLDLLLVPRPLHAPLPSPLSPPTADTSAPGCSGWASPVAVTV